MNVRNTLFVLLSATLALGLVSCSRETTTPGDGESVLSLGDFEDGTTCGWEGTDGGTVSVVSEHASSGTKALKVELPVQPYPGVGLDIADGDWTRWDVMRFTVYNPGPSALVMSIRIDDDDSKSYGTRFNLERRLSFKLESMRTTPVELPMMALPVGTLLSRGLRLDRIKLVRLFFVGLTEPATLVFDDFRLVRIARDTAAATTNVSLASSADYRAHEGTSVERIESGKTGSGLIVTFTPQGVWPGLDFKSMPQDLLGYDILEFRIKPGDPAPGSIVVKLTDRLGRSRSLATALGDSPVDVQVPLELAGQLELGHITGVMFFAGRPAQTQQLTLEQVSLRRLESVSCPPVHDAAVENAMFTLDFTAIGTGGRNTCFGATVRVPLLSGAYRTFYCSSPGKKQLTYAAAADVLAGMDYDKPIIAWGYFYDHGQWNWGRREVKATEGAPVVVRFTDRHDLSK